MQKPSDSVVTAWARLIRAGREVAASIESELKEAGFPPLCWYDVLLELRRAKEGRLTPRDLEARVLFEQYNLSRLLDRMEAENLLHRIPYPGDKRRQLIEITQEGRALQRRMWTAYGAAVERFVGSKLADGEAERLGTLLSKLIKKSDTESCS